MRVRQVKNAEMWADQHVMRGWGEWDWGGGGVGQGGLWLHLHLEQVFSAPLTGALIRSGHACLPRLAWSSGIGGRPAVGGWSGSSLAGRAPGWRRPSIPTLPTPVPKHTAANMMKDQVRRCQENTEGKRWQLTFSLESIQNITVISDQ